MWFQAVLYAVMAVLYGLLDLDVERWIVVSLLAYVAVLWVGIALCCRLIKVQRDLIERRSR